MVERNKFGTEELFDVLNGVSVSLEHEVDAYLIGGLGMMHHGLKATTKDVDVVFTNRTGGNLFEDALRSIGFRGVTEVPDEYIALEATTIMEGPNGIRFDIFVERVCKKLYLTWSMKERASSLHLDGQLRLMATSPEDLFLFKSVTDRDDDLADMALLAGLGLDWPVILDELRSDIRNRRYLPHLVVKLTALEKEYGIVVPGRRQLDEEAELTMGINVLVERFQQTSFSPSDAARALGEGDKFAVQVLDSMVDLGLITKTNELYRFVEE